MTSWSSTRGAALAVAMAGLVACGSDSGPEPEPLPEQPQIFANYLSSNYSFPLIEAGDESEYLFYFTNGGQNDLVLSAVTLAGPDAASFALTEPDTTTIASTDGASVGLAFQPAARGAYQATLTIESNAENFPALTYSILGLASASPEPSVPDILAFADQTTLEDNFAVVRYANVGQTSLNVYAYELADAGFALPTGTLQPSGCPESADCPTLDPAGTCDHLVVGRGEFVALGVERDGTAPASTTFTVVSNDPDTCALEIDVGP